MHKIRISRDIEVPSERTTLYASVPELGPRVTLISGGNGASSIAHSLKRYTHNSFHVVTMYDDGGSSRILRNAFNMPPPGDLRNLLMHMADESSQGRAKIVDVFRHRISRTEYDPANLQKELDSFISGSHPKMQLVERGLGTIISLYLDHFNKAKPRNFDLRGASIGNLVMTGCYLLHGSDFENAVYLISSLAKVNGNAIPVTLGNYHLGAELMDGNLVYGQSKVTTENDRYQSSIKRLFFIEKREIGAQEVQVDSNERALQAIRDADLIVYSIGSYFTSILCTLMTNGILETIAKSRAPKILIANPTTDDETRGLSFSQMLVKLTNFCPSAISLQANVADYVDYVITNDHGNQSSYRGIGGYIPVDKVEIERLGVTLLDYPLEKSQGAYDTDLVSRIILSFAHI
jgi:CofD-related protein of GAK system